MYQLAVVDRVGFRELVNSGLNFLRCAVGALGEEVGDALAEVADRLGERFEFGVRNRLDECVSVGKKFSLGYYNPLRCLGTVDGVGKFDSPTADLCPPHRRTSCRTILPNPIPEPHLNTTTSSV
ncbi:hypothetical protein [Salinigranum halophilum]|mgnify:FL=1|jgi:hypothetical protein|uniref:hypothetical protein n=1 Tax=Salinigranum halophilum TaxID=2565931 RepID=UPI0010A80EAC|nr:hypothetical protein [Salinigranum halophilum]